MSDEVGRITVWEPGVRLVLLYHDGGHELDGTEVEVRFEAIEGGTRVTLEHRGWDKLAPDVATRSREGKRWGWASILGWYKEWAFWGSPRRYLPLCPTYLKNVNRVTAHIVIN